MAGQPRRYITFGNVAGVVLGALGAVYGYSQAAMGGVESGLDLTPLQAALALGLAGLVLGRLAASILRTALSIAALLAAIAVVAFFFRGQLTAALGFDPFAWLETYFNI